MTDVDPKQEAPTPAARGSVPTTQPKTSLAVKASCLTFVFLFLTAIAISVYLMRNSVAIGFFTATGAGRILFVLLLILVIPIVVFRTITLFMMRETSKFADIDFAWRAGLEALSQNGISLQSAPIFLVFGGRGPQARRGFMHAAGCEFRVDGVPEGPAPLHWFANPNAIYIALNDASWLDRACTTPAVRHRPLPSDQPRPGGGPSPVSRTISPGDLVVRQAPEAEAAVGGRIRPSDPAERSSPERRGQDFSALRGTIDPSAMVGAAGPAKLVGARPKNTHRTSSQESTRLLSRLEHVCGLVRHARHPICPINGVLTLLPYEILQDQQQDVEELRSALAADLAVAQRELQLRCPVTAVVTGMEKERGFRELIRRVGPQRAGGGRFGQRFDLRTQATVNELKKFVAHVCGTFETWVYAMFAEENSLSRPGNNLLYAMLCRVRRNVRIRLGTVLAGFSLQSESDDETSIIFSGCYFAATGLKGERQAFVRGVFDKLQEEQNEIEWTPAALAEDRRNEWLTKIAWFVSVCLALGISGLIVWTKLARG